MFEYSDITVECTSEQYTAQFETADPVVGGRYLMNKDDWMQTEIEIVWTDGDIFLGQERGIKHGREAKGYFLYYAKGPFKGWRYNDTARSSFRLRNKDDQEGLS